MQTKTWPYGTEQLVKVMHIDPQFIICIDDNREGYVMAYVKHDIEPAVEQQVIIRFEKGGPTGGYWKIVRAAEAAVQVEVAWE